MLMQLKIQPTKKVEEKVKMQLSKDSMKEENQASRRAI